MIPISSLKALKLNKNQKEYRSLSVHYNITISHNQLPVLSKKPVSRNVQAAYELLLPFPLHIFRLSHFPLIVPEEKPRAERWYVNTSGPERAARKHQPQHDLSAPQEVHLQKWILTSLLPIWIRRSFLWIIHVYHRTTKKKPSVKLGLPAYTILCLTRKNTWEMKLPKAGICLKRRFSDI